MLSIKGYRVGDSKLSYDMGRKEEALKYLKMAEGMSKEMGMVYYLNKTQEVLKRI